MIKSFAECSAAINFSKLEVFKSKKLKSEFLSNIDRLNVSVFFFLKDLFKKTLSVFYIQFEMYS